MSRNVQIIIYPTDRIYYNPYAVDVDPVNIDSGVTLDVNLVEQPIAVTYSISDVRDLNSRNSSYSKEFDIPGTKKVNDLFTHIFEIANEAEYNPNKKLLCQVLQDGQSILVGYLQLRRIKHDKKNNLISYGVVVYSSNDNLIRNLSGVELQDLDFSSYNHFYSGNTITGSWTATTDNGGFVYPLIDYGDNWSIKSMYDVSNGAFVNYEKFKPAMYLKNIVDSIFDYAGYTYTSNFFDTDNNYRKVIIPLNTNFKYDKDYSQLHNFGAVTIANQTLNSIVTQQQTLQVIFGDEQYDYSDSFVVSAGTYTFKNAFRFNLKGTINIMHNVDFSGSKVYVRLNKASGGSELVYDSGYNISNYYTGQIRTIEIDTELYDAKSGDTLAVYAERIGQGKSITVMIGSSIELKTTDDLVYGSFIDMSKIMPSNVKAIDFLSSVFKTYNLYFEDDKENQKNIIIEPRDDFYDTEIIDWSSKLDLNKTIRQRVLPELQSKNIFLSFMEDKDYFNELYKLRKDKIYAEKKIVVDNDFLRETSKSTLDLIFAPTPLSQVYGSNIVIPKIFRANDAGIAKPLDSKMRLLYYDGLVKSNNLWTYGEDEFDSTLNATAYYPYTGHLDNPYNPSFDLNFGIPDEIYFEISGTAGFNQFTYLNENLYTNYWENTINEITSNNSRLVTVYLDLKPEDITTLSFRKSIRIDGVVYKLNKIIEYNPLSDETTKVELIKSITSVPNSKLRPRLYSTVIQINDTVTGRIDTGRNNHIANPFNIIIGDNNKVENSSEGNLIIGDKNILVSESNGAIVSGYYNSGHSKTGLILGGSGNTLNSYNINSGIILGTDNSIFATDSGRTNSVILAGVNNHIINNMDVNHVMIGGKNSTIQSAGTQNVIMNSDNSIISGSSDSIIQSSTNAIVANGNFQAVIGSTDVDVQIGDIGSVISSESIDLAGVQKTMVGASKSITSDGLNKYSVVLATKNIDVYTTNMFSILNSGNGTIKGNGGYSYNFVSNSKSPYINSATFSTLIGTNRGTINNVYSSFATIIGGKSNYNHGSYASIISSQYSTIQSTSTHSSILGGGYSTIYGTHSVIAGGISHTINGTSSRIFLGGGDSNTVQDRVYRSSILGGQNHILSTNANNSAIIGGSGYSATSSNMVYVPDLTVWNIASGGTYMVTADANGQLYYQDIPTVTGGTSGGTGGSGVTEVQCVGASNAECIHSGITGSTLYLKKIRGGNKTNVFDDDNSGLVVEHTLLKSGATGWQSFTVSGTSSTSLGNLSFALGNANTNSGNYSSILNGKSHEIASNYSSILGGKTNWVYTTSSNYSTVAGGTNNKIYHSRSFIGSGNANKISFNTSFIGGGSSNHVNKAFGSIVGGTGNYTRGYYAIIGAGKNNTINNNCTNSGIFAGANNTATSFNAFIGGGNNNSAGIRGAICAGYYNTIVGYGAGIVSGSGNTINGGGRRGFIGAGLSNTINAGFHSVIGAGKYNLITQYGSCGFIGAGRGNQVRSAYSSVIAGSYNVVGVTSYNCVINGGRDNSITSGSYSAIINGSGNTITNSPFSAIVNGSGNTINSVGGRFISILAGHDNNVTSANLEHTTLVGTDFISPSINNAVYMPKIVMLSAETGGTHFVTWTPSGGTNGKDLKYKELIGGDNVTVTDNGDNITISASTGGGGSASGTIVLINADETEVSSTSTNTTAKSYTLASNTYSRIIIESECTLGGTSNSNDDVDFEIVVGGTSKRLTKLNQENLGNGDWVDIACALKYSEAITAGATINISATVNSGGGTWTVQSLRVYGVVA